MEDSIDFTTVKGSVVGQEPPVLAALEGSSGITTKKIAQSHSLAHSLGKSPNLVMDSFEEASLIAKSKAIAQNELFASWAARSPHNAALAREDAEGLDGAFKAIGSWGEVGRKLKETNEGKLPERTLGDKWLGAGERVAKWTPRTAVGAGVFMQQGIGYGAGLLDWMEYGVAQGLRGVGLTDGQRTGIFGKVSDQALWQARYLTRNFLESDSLDLPESLRGGLWDNPEYLLDPEYLTFQVGEAASSLLMMMVGAGMVGGGVKTAAAIGGGMEAVSFYDDLRKDGVENDKALSASATFGVITGLLNRIGLEKILSGVAGKGVARKIREFAIGGTAEGLTEYLENPAQAIIEGITKNETPEQVLARFMDSLKEVDVIPGSFILGGGVRSYSSRRARATAYANEVSNLHEAVDKTHLKSESPALLEEMLIENGVEGKVFLPAESLLALYQTTPSMEKSLAIPMDSLMESAAMGQEVEVPVAGLVANLSQEQLSELSPHMREGTDGLTLYETTDEAVLTENAELITKRWEKEVEQQRELDESLAALQKGITEAARKSPSLITQLDEAGKVTELYKSFANRMFPTVAQRVDFIKKITVENFQETLFKVNEGQQVTRHFQPTGEGVVSEGGGDDGGDSSVTPQQPSQARGFVVFGKDGSYAVNLTPKADISTLIHETAHIFKSEMDSMVAQGLADESLTADRQTLETWLSRFDDEAVLQKEYTSRLKKLPQFGKEFSELNEAEKEEVRNTAKHEHFARGFESYVLEGKAPSEGLRSVFSRFRHWLMKIYGEAKNLGVELNDDVRRVFDRMLATEAEVEEAAAVNHLFALTQAELDKLGAKGAERNYQTALLEAAKRKAIEKAQEVRGKERAKRLSAWKKEARSELLSDQVYGARHELYAVDGALDIDAVRDAYGDEAVKGLRKRVGPKAVQRNGQDPVIFAAKHGFNDGAEMIAAITSAESMGKRIQRMVEAKEAQHDATVDVTPLLLETEEAIRQMELVGEYLSRNLAKEPLARKAFSLVASEQLAKMPMSTAKNEGQFTAAMRRALRKERVSIGKGDFKEALEANTQARLNMEFARQARELTTLKDRTFKESKRFVNMASADPVARYLVNDIASRFGFMAVDARLAENKGKDDITQWLNERVEEGFALSLDGDVLLGNTSWGDLSVEHFQRVAEAIKQVVTVERNGRKMLAAQDKADFNEAVDKAVATIHTYREAQPIKTVEEDNFVTRGLRHINAIHTKIEALCLMLDGNKPFGENWSLIYKPINDAEKKRGIMLKALAEQMNGTDLFGAYTPKEHLRMARKKVFEPAINQSITHEQRLVAALNMGNEGNYVRLLTGQGWTEEQAAKVVEPLDKRDWTFVQGIWDVFEGYQKAAFDLEEEVTGRRPTKVEATPFTTKFGEMRGGYFPVIYNQKHAKVDLQEKFITTENPAFAMTKHGHLKERNSHGAGTPLDLKLSAVSSRLNDVVTDLSFRRAYIDVGRVLKNTKYSNAIKGTVGHEQYQSMVSWFKDAAKIQNKKMVGDSFIRWGRTTATTVAMGFKATTIVAQPFGITQSIQMIGSKNVLKGLDMAYGKGWREMREVSAWVKSVSPFMDQRLKSYDRDVADATSYFAEKSLTPDNLLSELTTRAGVYHFEQWLKKNAFVPMGMVQYGVDLPTWLGAYQKGLVDFNHNEGKAIEYADSIVRLSQGSGQAKDLSRVQRGSEALKSFTMFYSYFNTLYNLTAIQAADVKMHRDLPSVLRAANAFLLLYVIPAIFSEIAAGRGPDEDEDWLTWSGQQVAMYPLQALAFGRTFAGAIEGEYGYTLTPAEKSPREVYNFLMMVNKGLFDKEYKTDGKKVAKQSLRTLGHVSGLPLGQVEITLFNILDYVDGTSEDFELRDLLYRRQKSRR